MLLERNTAMNMNEIGFFLFMEEDERRRKEQEQEEVNAELNESFINGMPTQDFYE